MIRNSLLIVLGLCVICEDYLAVGTFITAPEKDSYAEVSSEFLFNWTFVVPGVSIDVIKWYQSDAAGNSIGQLIMRYFAQGDSLRIYETRFKIRVSHQSNAAMLLKNITFSDEGYYTCDITDFNGIPYKNTMYLHVTIAPTLGLRLPNTSIVFINTRKSWSCQFDARPQPTIKWYLDDKEINSSRYAINTTVLGVFNNATRVLTTLTINSSQPEDTGRITCAAILPNSNITTSTNNIVYYAPRQTSFSSNILNAGDLGKPTTFTCSAKGNPQISYQIYKEDVLLSNTTTGIYVINSTSFNDSGLYWCIPVNYLGEGPKFEYNFTVYVSPVLQSQSPASIDTIFGSSVTIHCAFSGFPAPSITWQKVGGNISSAVNISYITTTMNGSYPVVNSTMKFDKIKVSDHGVYECIAKNPAGSPSTKFSINVTYQPEFSKNLSLSYTLTEDPSKSANWMCIASGNPGITITWNVNGAVPDIGYTVNERITSLYNGIQVESTLTMISITRNKSSIITCNATNSFGTIQSISNIIINYKPSTSRLMESILNITTGEPILLVCEIDSNPRSDIYWEKDGKLFNSSSISTHVTESNSYLTRLQSNLSINSGNKSDDGSYNCVAVNSIGNLTQGSYVHVNYAPEFLKSLQMSSTVLEGKMNYTLECIVRSKPISTIAWTKNGTVIQKSNKTTEQSLYVNETIKGATLISTITLHNIEKEDYGKYSCTARNFVGSANSEQLLVISYGPIIIQSSKQIVYVNETNSISLYCDFQSNPSAASIVWRLNNQPITSSNHAVSNYSIMTSPQHTQQRTQLTVTNVSRSDYGLYECEASNGIDTAKKNMTLIVHYAPLITQSMTGKYIKTEGAALNLSCDVMSNPTADINWTFNSSAINDSTNGYNVSLSTNTQINRVVSNTTLFIGNLRRTMQGYYACNAKNPQGSVQRVTTVIVHYGPTFTSSPVAIVNVDVGQRTDITCEVDSNPISNITWLKDDTTLSNSSDALISTVVTTLDLFRAVVRSTLRLHVISKNVTGKYSCRAAKDRDEKHRQTVVVVGYAPVLTYNFTAQQNLTESSDMIVLTCNAESNPASTIIWYKNGSPFTANIRNVTKISLDRRTILESSLIFPNGIKRTDYGRYSCFATNRLGNASFSTNITVWYGPVFHSNLTGQLNILESSNASFRCDIEGFPQPVVLWRKDGTIIQPGSYATQTEITLASENMVVMRSYLNFTNAMDNDTARYTCEASNIAKTNRQSQILNVQYSPKLLVESSNITVNQTDSVNFHCQTKANPPVSRHNWTKSAQLSETGSKYHIASAVYSSTGMYSCVAVNSIGSSPRVTFNLTVNVEPNFIKSADCVPNLASNKLICQCTGWGVPTPVVFWTKDASNVIIGSGNRYERSLASNDVNGKYVCHLKNLLGEVTSPSTFYGLNTFNEWGQWGGCNVTCGDGYQVRKRSCSITPCDNSTLTEYKNCTGPCVTEQLKKDEVWAMVLYILIPVIVVLILILLLWFVRTNRRKEDDVPLVVPVYGNLRKPPSTRSVPTNRGIYLPESNFGTVNSAYLEDAETPRKEDMFITVNDDDYENIEAEIKFEEDFPRDSSTDEDEMNKLPSPSPPASDDYLEILPNENSAHPSTEAIANGASLSHVFEDELVTSL